MAMAVAAVVVGHDTTVDSAPFSFALSRTTIYYWPGPTVINILKNAGTRLRVMCREWSVAKTDGFKTKTI